MMHMTTLEKVMMMLLLEWKKWVFPGYKCILCAIECICLHWKLLHSDSPLVVFTQLHSLHCDREAMCIIHLENGMYTHTHTYRYIQYMRINVVTTKPCHVKTSALYPGIGYMDGILCGTYFPMCLPTALMCPTAIPFSLISKSHARTNTSSVWRNLEIDTICLTRQYVYTWQLLIVSSGQPLNIYTYVNILEKKKYIDKFLYFILCLNLTIIFAIECL